MVIAVIYHHDERGRIEEFCRPLQAEGVEFEFAPIGLEVGTQAWCNAVESQLARADVFLVFLTAKSVLDNMVAWRIEVALSKVETPNVDKLLFPIRLDEEILTGGKWVLPKQINNYQHPEAYDTEGRQFWQRRLKDILSKHRPIKCFISYSRNDTSVAVKLKADLKTEGISAWLDTDDILAGASWDDMIAKAIKECSHFLLVVSPSSIQSSNVSDEVGYARETRRPILPLVIEKAPLPLGCIVGTRST